MCADDSDPRHHTQKMRRRGHFVGWANQRRADVAYERWAKSPARRPSPLWRLAHHGPSSRRFCPPYGTAFQHYEQKNEEPINRLRITRRFGFERCQACCANA